MTSHFKPQPNFGFFLFMESYILIYEKDEYIEGMGIKHHIAIKEDSLLPSIGDKCPCHLA